MSKKKGNLRTVHIGTQETEWKYIVEATAGKESEIRIYDPSKKMTRVPSVELVGQFQQEIGPSVVKQYIEKHLV